MAGQGVQRREVLRILGTAAGGRDISGIQQVGFCVRSYRQRHFADQACAVSSPILRTVGIRRDRATGRNHHSKRRDTGGKRSRAWRSLSISWWRAIQMHNTHRDSAITWLNAHSERTSGKPFADLTLEQQTSIARTTGLQRQGAPRRRGRTKVFQDDSRIHGDGLLHQRDRIQGAG